MAKTEPPRIGQTGPLGRTGTRSRTRSRTQTRQSALTQVVVGGLRAQRSVRRALVASVQWVRETVTPLGWLAVGAALLLPVGLILGWAELVVAGVVALALVVLAIPFLLGGQSYHVDLELARHRVVAGSSVVGGLTVMNVGRRTALPGRIDLSIGEGIVELEVPLLRPGHATQLAVEVSARRRGIITVGPVQMVRSDPLGLLKRDATWDETHELYVHPFTVAVPSTTIGFIRDLEGNPTSQIVNTDISFHAIREYVPGDPQKNVHWKSTAKTGTLMVRQYEESRRSRLALILSANDAEFANEDEFELAISAVGSLAQRAIRDGRDLAAFASAEIPEYARTTPRPTQELNVRSTRVLLDGLSGLQSYEFGASLEDVCSEVGTAVHDLSVAFVFVGSVIEPRRLRALSMQFPLATEIVAVVADPTAAPSYRRLQGLHVISIALIEDFKQLMARRAS